MPPEDWTHVGINKATKGRLNKNRAPGQSYSGFIWQLVDLWEKTKTELNDSQAPGKSYDNLLMQLADLWESTKNERVGSVGGNQGAERSVSHSA